jgi:hypothetical protein
MIRTVQDGGQKRRRFLNSLLRERSEGPLSEDLAEEYQGFSAADQKKLRESKVFIGFAIASGLSIDPMDHSNEDPPLPDVRTGIDGVPYYFELATIADPAVARNVANSIKIGFSEPLFYSQETALLQMLRRKSLRCYPTRGAPIDLVLYYDEHQYPPTERLLQHFLNRNESSVVELVRMSSFSRVWIYSDWPPQQVLWKADFIANRCGQL